MPHRRLLVISGLLLTLAGAAAAEPNVVKQVERLNRKALDDYDGLEFDAARQTLQTAIARLREAGLADSPVAARTYINLGIVYVAGLNDRARGVENFVNALRIDPTLQLDPLRGTPELQEAFDEAAREAAGMAKPPAPAPEPAPVLAPPASSELSGLVHSPVDEAKAGTPVVIKARLGADVSAARLVVFYRSGGRDEFTSLPMNAAGDEWSAEIPGAAVAGRTVQYYIEAQDREGHAVATAGSGASPFIISVSGEGGTAGGREGRGWGRLYVDVMLGTGVGIEPAGNRVDVAYQYSAISNQFHPLKVRDTGAVSAPLHLGVELGVQITRHVALSLLGRFQVYTAANADSSSYTGGTTKASGAAAGMLRFRYQFLDGRFHPYLHVDVGGGQIRHTMDISGGESSDHPLTDQNTAILYNDPNSGGYHTGDPVNEVCKNHSNCVDTVTIGAFLIGGGAGLWYDLTKFHNGGLGLIADLNILAAMGSQFGVNFDLQLGLGVHFL